MMEVHPEMDVRLQLSTNGSLEPMHQVKQGKVMNCGVLQDHSKGNFRYIAELSW